MLRKVVSNLLRSMSKIEKLRQSNKDITQVSKSDYNNKKILGLYVQCRYQFSNQQSKDPQNNKPQNKDETQIKEQIESNENIETIQVSIQQFRKMKQLLQQLKQQISDLQQQQQNNNNNSSITKKIRQPYANLSKKLQQFSKQSKVPQQISQQIIKQQQDSPLFFKSLQQQLSFQLIKLNSKEQFTQLIQHYLAKFHQIEHLNITKQAQKIDELIRLSYLIFYRYTSLQNAKIDDQPIKNLLLKIVSYIDILQQTQVEKLLSILNDQIKDREYKWNEQETNSTMYKINTVLHQNFRTFVKDIKKSLLTNNKVFNFKSKTNKNSQILSLICHFFDPKELSQSSFEPILQKQIQEQNSQKKFMIYNPANISHLLINMLQSNKNTQSVSDFYELFQRSLSITESNFNNQEIGGHKFQLQESLKMKNAKEFQRYQYEGIIYFLQNFPQTNQNLFSRFFSLLFSENRQIQKFQLIHQLRICLGFLIRPQLLNLNQSFDPQIVSEIHRILLSSQTKDSLFQSPKQSGQLFETDDNGQFLHLKKVAMILSQIGIQLFKNYRMIVKDQQNNLVVNNLKDITLNILKRLNQVCIEKVDLKDIFKNEQKQNMSQKLILNLNLFQFIVNLNILSKWCGSLTNNSNNQGLSSQLLTNLVSIFISQTKNTLLNQHNTEQQKLKLAEQLVITLLIGRQHSTILKSIENYFEQSQNKEILGNLLQITIGKNDKHKYFQQYLVLQKQFKF